MNDWKDVPHLFANGNFKIEIHYKKDDKEIYDFDYTNLLEATLYPDHCRLFARKIEDMTLEEVQSMPHLQNIDSSEKDFWIKRIIRRANEGTLELNEVLHLTSIAVYPLHQSDFGKNVIDIKEFDNE